MHSVIYAECHIQALYAEFHYAECRGAIKSARMTPTAIDFVHTLAPCVMPFHIETILF
jgi:hypothetical protein